MRTLVRNRSVRQFALAAAFIVAVSLFGIVGFMIVEHYSFLDALYMTAITVSTVGYETIGEFSPEGKVFSVLLVIFSAGSFVLALSTITRFVVEGEVRQAFQQFRVNKKVQKLEDHIIICGLGRNGSEAVNELIRQEQSFVIIEADQAVMEEFRLIHPEALMIKGDATHEEVMELANIENARGLISALSSDAENVYITLTARQLNPRIKIVARASHETTIPKLRRAGADHVILPNVIGGQKMANIITRPALNEFIEMMTGQGRMNLHIEDVLCADHGRLVGRTLAELEIKAQTGVLVLGYKHGNTYVELNPKASHRISSDDRLFIIGNSEQLENFHKTFLRHKN